MQRRGTRTGAFFCLSSLDVAGLRYRRQSDSQQKRSLTTMQSSRKAVILLLFIGIFLTCMSRAAAPGAANGEDEGSHDGSVKDGKAQHGDRERGRKGGEKQNEGGKDEKGEYEDDSSPTRCAQNLRDAVNGAISLIAGTRLLVEHLLRLWDAVPYVPMLVCPSSLFPYNPTLPWPKREKLRKGDLLRDVLDNGVLTVAGVGGASLSNGQVQLTVAKDRGEEGNYTRAEPTGFFPDYLRAIADIIEKHYNSPIRVHWLFYPSVESAQAGVLRGEAHMTDIYFLLAHSTPGEPQPLAHFYSTCPVVGSPVLLIVRQGPVFGCSDINDFVSLNRVIDRAKTVGEAAQLVVEGNALAVVTTGVLPRLPPVLKVVGAHILLGKGAWIERTYAVECVEEEHGFDLALYAKERSPQESGRVFGGGGPGGNDAASQLRLGGMQCAAWVLLISLCALF